MAKTKKTENDETQVLKVNAPTMAGRGKEAATDPLERLKAARKAYKDAQQAEIAEAQDDAKSEGA